ncbi:hypothetical protein GKZ68_10385 [Hymenobacter sp. BRD128]|uniref:hypothetical protein n=1 Tax=Hymenobacter sp. BRD128 TaxID=2675878 RepID=UPI001566B81A|nr:hypothetical protein [Hymenobacter sp. BRD128]QKG56997.1 hypothetical protein GKZ68_10385 [Hymenobacter sp. BRD128]
MADTLVIQDTTYAGEAAAQFAVKAVVGNEIVQGGHVYVRDGIKKALTIPRMVVGNVIQDRKPTPDTSLGTMTVDGRTLVPADYTIYAEFNPRDFEQHWYATQLNPTLIDRRLPVTIESVIIQEVLKRHNEYLGLAILQGNTSLTTNLKYFNGLITRAKADVLVPKVASPVALTTVNIGDALQSTLNSISRAVLYNPGLKFFVSYKTAQIWEQYQRNTLYKGVDMTAAGIMRFAGRTIVPLNGMPDDTIFLAIGSADSNSNLWVGMNSTDDNTLQLQRLQNNSELYFVKMLMKVDTNYGFSEETALYAV